LKLTGGPQERERESKMNGTPSPDAPSPEHTVLAFIRAMHSWEEFAWQASREARRRAPEDDPTQAISEALDKVFAQFCTPKDRPFGRAGSFQDPPECDPSRERVVRTKVVNRRAEVETERNAVLGGGPWLYVLHLHDGRWLIDNVKWNDGTTWKRGIL
jgi:hypothetical protein